MNIDPLNPRHWKILLTSAAFLSLAVLRARRNKRHTTTRRVVFFSAVERPTVTRLIDQLVADGSLDWELLHCSFEERAKPEVDRYGEKVRWINPGTWAGAKELVSADVIVTSDRLRTLGIVLHGTAIPFVDVWHGISFKHIKRPGFLRHYSEIWVSSDYIKELYQQKLNVPKEKLKVTGFSPADPLYASPQQSKDPDAKPRILIAPTWSPKKLGNRARPEVAFWEDYAYLSALAKELDVSFIMRSHFLDHGQGRSGSEGGDIRELSFVPQTVLSDPSSLLAEADVLVTDWSSLAFEFLPTTRPTLFIENTSNRPKKFLVTAEERWGPVVSTHDDFRNALKATLKRHREARADNNKVEKLALNKFHRPIDGQLSASIQADRLRTMLSRR